jgi:site-specific DNA-methyltransferase (adenine-specific)
VANWELFTGDCLDVLPTLEAGSIDAIVTDPPFTFAGGISNGRTSMASNQFFLHWWRAVCKELNRVLRPEGEGFIWCDWRSATTIAAGFAQDQKYTWKVSQMLYHYREMPGQGQPFRNSVDLIAYLRGPKSNPSRIPNTTHNWISKYWYYGKHEFHPAEKDAGIAEQLIAWCSNEEMTVLDPFMGSGTTGVAAMNTGRNFVGVELDEGYAEIARRRIEHAAGQARQLELIT